MRRSRLTASIVFGTGILLIAGCGGPYRISDTANPDQSYYAKSYKEHRDGSITFTDAATDAKVTLQSSSVLEISNDDWKAAVDK